MAWDYTGKTDWAPSNVAALCRGAEQSTGPAVCFQRTMHGGVNWGGGTQWQWQNALKLCSGALDGNARVDCFQGQIASGRNWSSAIAACQSSGQSLATTQAGAAQPGKVTGRDVGLVRFAKGSFEARGGQWVELGADGEVRFAFVETGRDDWSVYLFDQSRNVRLQLDLHRRLVLYAVGTEAMRPLYDITAVARLTNPTGGGGATGQATTAYAAPSAPPAAVASTPARTPPVVLIIQNVSSTAIDVFVDVDTNEPAFVASLEPGFEMKQQALPGSLWRIAQDDAWMTNYRVSTDSTQTFRYPR